MSADESWEDRTLLRLRRQYSKDETVAALNKKISEQDQIIGELRSEVDRLEHELKHDEENREVRIKKKALAKLDESYMHLKNQNISMRKTIKKLKEDYSTLLARRFNETRNDDLRNS